MTTLTIASKANQATTLPVLLVASLVKESVPEIAITFKFDEVEVLGSSNSAVELVVGTGSPVYGFSSCLDKFAQEYPFLSGKHDAHVRQASWSIKQIPL